LSRTSSATVRNDPIEKEEPSRTASLFDVPASPATTAAKSDEEEEILVEAAEDEPTD